MKNVIINIAVVLLFLSPTYAYTGVVSLLAESSIHQMQCFGEYTSYHKVHGELMGPANTDFQLVEIKADNTDDTVKGILQFRNEILGPVLGSYNLEFRSGSTIKSGDEPPFRIYNTYFLPKREKSEFELHVIIDESASRKFMEIMEFQQFKQFLHLEGRLNRRLPSQYGFDQYKLSCRIRFSD